MKPDSYLFDMLFLRKVPNFRTPMSRKLVGGIYIYRKRNIPPIRTYCDKVYRRRWYHEDDLTSEDEDVSDKQISKIFDGDAQSEDEVQDEKIGKFNFSFSQDHKEEEKVQDEKIENSNFILSQNSEEEQNDEPLVTPEDIGDEQIIKTFDDSTQSEEEIEDEKIEKFSSFSEEDKEEREQNDKKATPEPIDRIVEDETRDDSVIVEEIDIEKQIVMSGYYKKGFKVGTWWFNYKDGSALVGELDPNGKLSGENIAYIYPDRWSALVGHFEDGVMMSAKLARVAKIIRNVPEFYFVPSSAEYKYDISTHDCISNDPLLSDPYEKERVYVNQSKMTGAGEGLFAKLDFGPGVVVSFYNGVRLGNDEVDARSWDENGYTMIVNNTEVLDVPKELVDTSEYCASLGHKLNHSFQPNCVTELFNHPRFGNTVAVRTNQAVAKGSELTINYGYGLRMNSEEMDVPDWYRRQLELFVNS